MKNIQPLHFGQLNLDHLKPGNALSQSKLDITVIKKVSDPYVDENAEGLKKLSVDVVGDIYMRQFVNSENDDIFELAVLTEEDAKQTFHFDTKHRMNDYLEPVVVTEIADDKKTLEFIV